jgi:hypothetical protein
MITECLKSLMALNQCKRAYSFAARDLVGLDDFNELLNTDELLKRDRLFRRILRHYPKIAETIGE